MIGSAGEIRSSRLVATRVHVPARYRPASPAGVRILELRAASRRARTIVSHAHCRFEDSLSGHSSGLNLRMRRGTISLPMWNDQRRSHESQTRAMKLEHVVPLPWIRYPLLPVAGGLAAIAQYALENFDAARHDHNREEKTRSKRTSDRRTTARHQRVAPLRLRERR